MLLSPSVHTTPELTLANLLGIWKTAVQNDLILVHSTCKARVLLVLELLAQTEHQSWTLADPGRLLRFVSTVFVLHLRCISKDKVKMCSNAAADLVCTRVSGVPAQRNFEGSLRSTQGTSLHYNSGRALKRGAR